MTMFVLHQKMSPAELQAAADKTKPEIEAWFAKNPKRRVCNAQLWYDKVVKVHRGKVSAELDAAVQAQLTSESEEKVTMAGIRKQVEEFLAEKRAGK